VTDPAALPHLHDPSAVGPASDAEVAEAIRRRVMAALAEEGFRPEIDEDGDVVAKVEGQPMFVRCFATSPPLLRVSSQWLIDAAVPGDELTRLRAANAMTGVLNLIKVTLLEDRLVVAVDLVVHEAMDLRSLLTATLEAIRSSVQTWHATIVQLLAEQAGVG
jgi:hypothetical protein